MGKWRFQEAFALYVELQTSGFVSPTFSLASALKTCARIGTGYVVMCMETALLEFYTKVGDMRTAQKVFDEMSERNVVSWNSMIDGYLRSGDLAMAKGLFSSMTNKDVVSWNCMVSGYFRNGDMDKALSLFQEMPERKLSSWNAMISGYRECGDVESARELFSKIDRKDHLL
ncbi:Pentatricopeptide repeat-containing protein [Artemisia annua]|uniref:Pentatricopeptide repeat-containing protein n=1 Tax=Artemisia annua TaxID=35608 RepID=A0A2U1KX55_ARTAN|nr:Pentatricopeptide repeat-containing protein [Artemisia annua]